ncbi:hypothetical protein [Streptacidiphilus sp. PAMC 29251]
MSGALVVGLIVAGVVLAGLGAGALSTLRDTPRLRRLRAVRWAKDVDLALPPELVDPLALRLRRVALTGFLLAALLETPAAGFMGWRAALEFGNSQNDGPAHGPLVVLLLLTATSLTVSLAQLREISRQRRADSLSGLREVHIGLRDVVPAWLVWTARGITAAVPVLAAALLWHMRRQGYGQGASPYAFGALLLCGLLAQRGVENRQLVVLNGRQSAGSPQGRAFDDAFRVRTALGLVTLVPTLVYLAACALLQPAFAETAVHSHTAARDFVDLWMPLGLALVFFTMAQSLPAVRRHYRGGRRQPPAAEPPTTETAPC